MRFGVGACIVVATLVSPAYGESRRQEAPPPIVRTNTPIPSEKYGDWIVEPRPGFFGAYTNNESGTSFGVLCGKSCVIYMTSTVSCEVGHRYPALINSDAGANAIEADCLIVEGSYVYATALTDDFVSILAKGGKIGVATPLADGRFSVSRYSLSGALAASQRALSLSEAGKAQDDGALRDFTL